MVFLLIRGTSGSYVLSVSVLTIIGKIGGLDRGVGDWWGEGCRVGGWGCGPWGWGGAVGLGCGGLKFLESALFSG